MSPDDKRAKVLDKVRKLLAQAESTTYAAEADACRERADELMTAYAIEVWQLAAVAEKEARGGFPERRYFDWEWTRTTPFREELGRLFNDVLRHCRCVPVERKAEWRNKRRIPVIGLPADLDYADLLFTSLMLQLVLQADPEPNPELTFAENLTMLREAGLDWQEIAERLRRAELLPERYGQPEEGETRHYWRSRYRRRDPNWWQRTAPKLAAAYRRHCQKSGRPQSYVDTRRYRKSFADGFVTRVGTRLWRMEKKSQGPSDSTALVLRDIYQANRRAVYEFYPDLKPHDPDCGCEKCLERRLREASYKPGRELRLWERDRDRTDFAAYSAGGEAGERADIVSGAPRLKPRAALGR